MASETQRASVRSTAPSSRAWEALTPPLAEWILDAISSMGFKRMTPVQASTIPQFMKNKDVVVEAVTGSGKTLAYLIPVVEKLLRLEEQTKRHHVGAIILSPTRELATQIHGVLQSLLAFHGPSVSAMEPPDDDGSLIGTDVQSSTSSGLKVVVQLLVGGDTPTSQDLSNFLKNSPNLLVATPGRLLELLSSPHFKCPQSSFEVLVLDEADRLLDLGFREDLQKILGRLPKQRRTGLFSASVSDALGEIVRVGLRNPVKISVKVKGSDGGQDRRTPSSLQMSYLLAPASQKLPAISKILSALEPSPNKTIIFLSTCAAVDYFQHVLPSILPSTNRQLFNLVPLHGKHPAKARIKNLAAFADSSTPSILLTTDVAARGLDIPQTDLVIQVDPPSDPKVFLHRCGRSGRAGRKGLSVALLQPGGEEDYISFLEVRKTPITPLTTPHIEITDDDARAATTAIRQVVLSDRAINDKAKRGFVSWVRSYSKHQASSIFRIADLDWHDLGNAWGLLKLPKMPELKNWPGDMSLGLDDIDWDAYAYKDKRREDARRKALVVENSEGAAAITTAGNSAAPLPPPPPPENNTKKPLKRAWSNKLDAREERELRRTKRRTRREREKWENMTEAEKVEQRELERLIEEVKARKAEEERFGEFEGFD